MLFAYLLLLKIVEYMGAMTCFLVIFLVTNLGFALCVAGALIRFREAGSRRNGENAFSEPAFPGSGVLVLCALGAAPALTSLLLYYLLLLFPGLPGFVYAGVVLLVFAFLGWWGRSGIRSMAVLTGRYFMFGPWKERSDRHRWPNALYLILLAVLIVLLLRMTVQVPLSTHDVLGYGVVGKGIAAETSLDSVLSGRFDWSGFQYRTKHAPSFPLLLTWECFFGGIVGYEGDLYYRSVGFWYALLIAGLQYVLFSRINRWLALVGGMALLSGLSFYFTFLSPHLDSFRIFLLLVSWVWMALAIRDGTVFDLLMFGVFSGLAAFAHSIGVAVAMLNIIVFFCFTCDPFSRRIWKTAVATGLLFCFGGLHYVIDTIWGRGWVLGR